MNVRSILQSKGAAVHTIAPSERLDAAARELDARGVGALVVVDGARRVTGVFSERDLAREVAQRGSAALERRVEEAMTRGVATVTPGDTLDVVMGRMTDRRVRHLPVIEDGRLAGIVSIGDVVKRKIEEAEAESQAMRDYISAS